MSNLADVASAAAARQQLTDRHTLGAPLSPGSPKDKVAPNRELLGSARSSDPSATDHAENDDDTQHAVFEVHGKTVKFAKRSCFCLTETNPLRIQLVRLTQWVWFERVVLALILANSIILGLPDYNFVDSDGELSTTSLRNRITLQSELFFTIVFSIECAMKILAMGFFVDSGSYLRDPWNGLDFVVVMGGLVAIIPGVPNISALRTIRVLRPLRSLVVLPGMRLLVTSLLRSIPALLNVVALLLFVFAIFGILGLQLWSGLFHARCRLTAAPVRLTGLSTLGACEEPNSLECSALLYNSTAMQQPEFIVSDSSASLQHSSWLNTGLLEACKPGVKVNDKDVAKDDSPWAVESDCFWPADPEDESLCSMDTGGQWECPNAAGARWCGSNFDNTGNERFSSDTVMRSSTFYESLNWGFIVFDNIGLGLLAIFQSITLEGWTVIMYQTMDVYTPFVGGLYFIILIMFGSFFLLNLTLAVIWENFSKGQEEQNAESSQKTAAARKIREQARTQLRVFRDRAQRLEDMRLASSSPQQQAMHDDSAAAPAAVGGWSLSAPSPAASTGTSPAAQQSHEEAVTSTAAVGFASGHVSDVDAQAGSAPLAMIGASSADPDRNARAARTAPGTHSSHDSDTIPPHAGVQAPRVASVGGGGISDERGGSSHPTTAPQSTSHTPTNPPGSHGSPIGGIPADSPALAAAAAGGGPMAGASTPELAPLGRESPTLSHGLRTKMEANNRKTPPKSHDGTGSVRSGDSHSSGDKPPRLTGQRVPQDSKSASRTVPRTDSGSSFGIAASVSMRSQLSARDLEEAQVRLQALKIARKHAKVSARQLRTPNASSARDLSVQGGETPTPYVSSETFSGDKPVDSAVKRYGAWIMNQSIPPEVRLAEVRRREVWLNAAPWRRSVHDLVMDDLFTGSITLLILINTAVLAADRYPIDASEADSLEIVNFVCTLLFAMEMVLKLIGLGPAEYIRDGFNVFDALIVMMSMVELVVSPPAFFGADDLGGGAGGGISALRTFRLFRVFKLAASWPSLKNLLNTILKTVKDIGNFGILLLLFIYIFALVGMQFFANQLCYEADTGVAAPVAGTGSCPDEFERPRANFDHLTNAIATVFMVLTGENWNSVMYDAWRSTGGAAVVYFILLVVIGNFIVLNLFLAILLGNFEGIDLTGDVSKDPAHKMKQQGPGGLKKRQLSRRISRLVRRASETEGTTVGWAAAERRREDDIRPSRSQRIANAMDETPYYEDLPCHRKACALISGHVRTREGGARGTTAPHGSRVTPLGNIRARGESSPGSVGGNDTPQGVPIISTGNSASDLARMRSGDAPSAARNPLDADSQRSALQSSSTGADGISPVHSSSLGRASSMPEPSGGSTQGSAAGVARQSSDGTGGVPKTGGNRAARRRRPGGRAASRAKNRRGSVMNTLQGALGIQSKQPNVRSKRASMVSPPPPEVPPERMQSNSLGCMPPTNRFRAGVFAVTSHAVFDRLVLLLILISSVTLAIDNPLNDPDGTTARAVFVIDIMLTVLFTIEMTLKIIALGLVMHKESYLRSGWNMLDGTIVIISIISLAMEGNSALSSLRALRALRALRPLRVVSRRPGLRLVVNALIGSMKSIFNVLLVVIMMFLIFGILAVNYFKGSFYACAGDNFDGLAPTLQGIVTYPLSWNDVPPSVRPVFNASDSAHASTQSALGVPSDATPEAFFGEYTTTYFSHPPVSKLLCLALGATWEAALESRFDNVFQSIGTLFEMSTTEGWADVMWQGVDSRGIEMQPVRDHQPGWVWFFMFFMVVGSFFAVNLFVGVVIDNFNQMKVKQGGSILLTDEQKEWIKTQEAMLKLQPFVQPPRATNAAMAWCQRVVAHQAFEVTIVTCIMLNTLTMAMEYFGASQQYRLALLICNYAFAVVFLCEAVVKLLALRWVYFKSSWNRFDFVVVLASIAGVIVEFTTSVSIGSAATVIRTFRVLRVLRLVKKARRLNQLFKTLMLTLPSLGNIGGLMFLLIFIYAVMGVQLFAGVQYGEFIDRHANFQSFGLALLVLVRASTGESWNGIMYEAANQDDCVDLDALPYDDKKNMCGFSKDLATCEPITGCGSPLAFVFFFSFTVFVSFVFLNLLIAVVIEGFSETDDTGMRLSDENFDHFRTGWVKHDPAGSGTVPSGAAYKLLQELPEPLGFGQYEATQKELRARLNQLKLKVTSDGHVRFHDMGQALAKRVFEESLREQGKEFEVPEHLAWDSDEDDVDEWSLEHFLAASRINRFLERIVLQRRTLRSLAAEHDITEEEAARLLSEAPEEEDATVPPLPAGGTAGQPQKRALSRNQRRSLAMAMQGGAISLANPFSASSRQRVPDTEPPPPVHASSEVDTDVQAAEAAPQPQPRARPVAPARVRPDAPHGAPAVRRSPPRTSDGEGDVSAVRNRPSPLPSIGNTPANSPLPSRNNSNSEGSASGSQHSHRGSAARLPAIGRPVPGPPPR